MLNEKLKIPLNCNQYDCNYTWLALHQIGSNSISIHWQWTSSESLACKAFMVDLRSLIAFCGCHHCWLCRWALGVLIYYMLRGEMPFGSWRENELDTVAKIAKRKLHLPETFSPEAVDLISKVLQELRLSQDTLFSLHCLKWHLCILILFVFYLTDWFSYLKWKKTLDLVAKVLILSRVTHGLIVLNGKGLDTTPFPFRRKLFLV